MSRGASYSMETPSTPGRRGSSTSSWVKEGTTGTSSFWRDGTSASSWRDGSSACPSYTPRSTYSKSEQSWRLPRWTRTIITFFLLPYTGRHSHQLQLRDPQHQRGDFGQSSKCLYFSFQKRFIQLPVADSNKVRRSPNFKGLISYFPPDQAATTDHPPRSDRKTSSAKSRTTRSVTETELRNQHPRLLLIDLPFLLLGGSKLPPILPLACARGDVERGEERRRSGKTGRS